MRAMVKLVAALLSTVVAIPVVARAGVMYEIYEGGVGEKINGMTSNITGFGELNWPAGFGGAIQMDSCSLMGVTYYACGPAMLRQSNWVYLPASGYSMYDEIIFSFASGYVRHDYLFPVGAFTHVGTYQALDRESGSTGWLRVTDSAAPVPEPDVAALLVAGGCVLARISRRRGRDLGRN